MRRYGLIIVTFLLGVGILLYPHMARMINERIQASGITTLHDQFDDMTAEEVEAERDLVHDYNQQIFLDRNAFSDPFGTNGDNVVITSSDSSSPSSNSKASASASVNADSYYDDWDYNPEEGADDDDSERINRLHSIGLPSDMFASLEIPKLNQNLPIYIGSSRPVLARGVGVVDGSSLPGGGPSTHTVLAGHRGMATQAMFRNLDRLKPGDVFHIKTSSGKLTYRVYDTEIILPHETSSLNIVRDKDLATLLTCHPYRSNSHRLLVHGERVN